MFWLLLLLMIPVAIGLYVSWRDGWDIEMFFLGFMSGIFVDVMLLLLSILGYIVWTEVGWGL